jgi:predicted metal-dependent phosphoesterase TrpH
MAIIADLHCHSTASDGVDPPARVMERAAAAGLRVVSLTDHDTLEGVPEAQEAGRRLGIEVVPGVELTCYHNGKEVNILGYGVDGKEERLAAHCRRFVAARIDRAHQIGVKLAALGAPIDVDALIAKADGGVVGRPHVATALVEAGHVATLQEAFDRYLANGGPADVPKMMVDPQDCIDMIHHAGGIAVIAHAGIWNQYDLIPVLVRMGLDGVEVWHSAHSPQESDRLEEIADRFGLAKAGGSDCHGLLGERRELLGTIGLDEMRWKKLKSRMTSSAHR